MGQTGGGWENLGALPFREKLWFFWFFWFFCRFFKGFSNLALVFLVFLVFSNGFGSFCQECFQILSRAAPNKFPFIFNRNLNRNQSDSVLGCSRQIVFDFELRFEQDSVLGFPRPISFYFQQKCVQKLMRFGPALQTNFLQFHKLKQKQKSSRFCHVLFQIMFFISNWKLNRKQLDSVLGWPRQISFRPQLKFEQKSIKFSAGLPKQISFHVQLKVEQKEIRICPGLLQTEFLSFAIEM